MTLMKSLSKGLALAISGGFLSGEAIANSDPSTDFQTKLQVSPNLELMTDEGAVLLSDQSVQLIYLDFWASWCAPCKLSFPFMQGLHQRYGDAGLKVIAICLDQHRKDADKFLKSSQPSFTIAYDPKGASARQMGLKTMPSAWVMTGKELRMLYHHAGFRASDPALLEPKIKQLLLMVGRAR